MIYMCHSPGIKKKMNPRLSEANRNKHLSEASVHSYQLDLITWSDSCQPVSQGKRKVKGNRKLCKYCYSFLI
jgi:hypothetical protein